MNSTNSIKLIIVGSFPQKSIYGGIERSCKLIEASPDFKSFQLIRFDSTQISNPPPSFVIRFFLAVIRLCKFMFKMLIEKPQVALIFCAAGASALEKGLMGYVSKMLGCKVLIFPRAGILITQSEGSYLFKRAIQFLFQKADVFLAQGNDWFTYAQVKWQMPLSKIKIIRNWSATQTLLSIGAQRKWVQDSNSVNFIFVGWLEKEKGVIEILSALQSLQDKAYDFTFTFIGDGKIMKTALQFVVNHNLTNKVSFKGWVAADKVKGHLIEADVFVLPSWAEGMPNALIEALSCKLAAVTTNVGMIPNYLKHNEDALIIPPKDSNALFLAMEKLILNPRIKINLAKNGYKVASSYFSTEKGLKDLALTIKST